MDSSLLEKFRRQLATWIELRLDTQPLPFQKLEVSPRILTAMGRLAPDLVLWINRDSQLAGSMILLPVAVDEKTLAEGRALAEALGLNHFTTWAAREVCIWSLAGKCLGQGLWFLEIKAALPMAPMALAGFACFPRKK